MRFGLNVMNAWSRGSGGGGVAEFLLELGVAADAAGWEGFFLWDHLTYPWVTDSVDPQVILAALAVRTGKVRLGTLVTPLARRRPQKVAQELVTLDHLSRGRAVLGVGVGASGSLDFEAFSEETDLGIRAGMLDEALEVVLGLWSGETFHFHGEHFKVDGVRFLPRPLQEPRIPVWVGGESKPALRRASRLDGWAPIGPASVGGFPGVEVEDLEEAVIYIEENRRGPIDVVYTMDLVGDEREQEKTVSRLEGVGATWVLEHIYGYRYSPEEALERVRRGPPNL